MALYTLAFVIENTNRIIFLSLTYIHDLYQRLLIFDTIMTKPYAESCAQNQQAILDVLKIELQQQQRLLEIGSGTGQHAVYFSRHFPQLQWQTSDLGIHHPGIQAWIDDSGLDNVMTPLQLNVMQAEDWPDTQYDVIFSANAVHIMSWLAVEAMFSGIGRVLNANGKLILYGPFNYAGQYTSESNARFDLWLKQRDPESAIRDFEALDQLAIEQCMSLIQDYAMPANNRILIWQKLQ